MKSLIQAVAVAAVLIVPVASFAQSSDAPVTRAQVRAELVQLEQAGYHVGDGDQTKYPAPIQAAEAKVAAQDGQASGFGGVAGGSSSAGRPTVSKADWNAMYSHP